MHWMYDRRQSSKIAAHSDDDIERTIAAAGESLRAIG
jgi:hypothetical protein